MQVILQGCFILNHINNPNFYCMMKHLFVILFTLTGLGAMAQTITGKVTSGTDGSGLPGATVQVKGAASGTSTDVNGNYTINAGQNAMLVFSSLGYRTVEIAVGNRSIVNAVLEEDNTQLSEVTVTAFGVQRAARSLGYTSQTVNSEKLTVNKQNNLVNALQGKMAGVQIVNTGGAPGAGARIQIRGINSIDPNRDNSPLFVIDGVIMDNSTSTQGSDYRAQSNRAIDINPDDIENINILRGGAATALYGLRGSNGVVVITTKSGKTGKMQVVYSGSFGVDEVNRLPQVQNTYTQGWAGVYDTGSFWPSTGPTVEEARKIDPTHPDKLFDTFKDAWDTGHQMKNNLSFSGGTDKISYMSSISHFTQKGLMPFTNFENLQARLNTTIRPSSKFSVNTNMSVNNSGGNRGNVYRYNEQVSYWAPRYDIRNYEKPDGTMLMEYPGLSQNPIYIAKTNKFEDDVLRFIGNVKFNYNPLEWLGFSYTFGVDTYRDTRLATAPGFQGLAGEVLVDDNGGTGAAGRGFISVYENKQKTFNSTFLVNLSHKINDDLSGTLTLGNEFFSRNIYRSATEGWNLAIWNWFSLSNANQLAAGTYQQDYRLMGNFADLTFNFKDYLYLNLTGRNDVTSSLLSPYNSFFYPSVNLSYIVSDHLKLPAAVDYAKLRISYAKVGKDANPYATSQGFASYTGLPTGFTGFTRAALLGNPLLRPEFTDTYEIGTELNFYSRRLRVDANFYNSVSSDQILAVPVSTTTGYATASTNVGSIRNRGIELTIGGTPLKTADFSWESDFNISANRNKVLSINSGANEIVVFEESGYLSSNVTMRLIPGESYGVLYGRGYKRYYSPDEIAQGLDKGLKLDKDRPIVIGANGFPVLDATSNRKQLGNVLPKFIAGWNNTFRYKNVSLSMLWDGQFGHQAYNKLDNHIASFLKPEYTLNRNDHIVFDGVLADGTKNTQEVWLGQGVDPKTGRNYGNGYYRDVYRGNSEFFVQDISWLKLRTVALNYSLPKKWLPNNFLNEVSIGFTGNNLLIFSKFNGYDPESISVSSGSNVSGFAGFTYPGLRSYIFNLNVKF